jgi:hypothetical protein
MADYTYLVNDLIEACENDSTEFSDYVPKMINRAEERLTRDLDDYGLVTEVSIAVSSNTSDITLPTGTRIVKNLNIESNSSRINLLLRTDEYLNSYWPVSASTGTPKYYARITDTLIRVAPTPTSTYDGRVVYVSRPTTLTSASNTNYFTDICYDALFNAAMVEAMVFTKNFTTVQFFEGRYTQAVESLRNQARRTRRDDVQTAASPAGADNNLIQNQN